MPDYVYMGRRLGRARQGILLNGKIKGETIPIYTLPDGADPPDAPIGIEENYPDATKSEVNLTGGVTRYWGTAMNFSGSFEEVPVLFSWENPSPYLKEVNYNLHWMHMNPGALARIDTLAEGEVRQDGRLVALTKRNEEGNVYAYEYGDETLERTATSLTYSREHEMIAFGSASLTMENPAGSATIVHEGALAPTVMSTLEALGITETWKRATLKDDPQAAANEIWERTTNELAPYTGGHWAAVVNSRYSGRKDDMGPKEHGEILAVRGPDGQKSIEAAPDHLIPKPGETV